MLLSTGALPSTDDIRYTTTKFCKLKIRTVVTEEGTSIQLFCRMWKRASNVYDYTALYDGTVHRYCLSAWWGKK